jgi:putative flippase GtrA
MASNISNIFKKSSLLEFLRYGIVGIFFNALGYSLYIVLTLYWLSPFLAVAIFYPISVTISYFAHRKHTFKRHNVKFKAINFIRYFIIYITGYIINLTMIIIFYNYLHIPHQIVQLVAIFIVAIFLFIAVKLFVFTEN